MPGQPEQGGRQGQYEGQPDFSGMQQIQGYENAGFGQGSDLVPPPMPPPPSGQAPEMQFGNVGGLSEQEVRDALLDFAAENCCYGTGVPKDMNVNEIQASTALHYTLETFCEARTTEKLCVPYSGGPVDGPEYGPAPGPWDMQIQADMMFADHVKTVEVPHTAFVQSCYNCHGRGRTRCMHCQGDGRNRCTSCGGDGTRQGQDGPQQCYSCHGSGQSRCHTCGGDGMITCRKCQGHCNLRWFIRLNVSFKNHESDYILEKTDMPDHLVRNVSGQTIFEQTMFQVWPIAAYPLPEINQASISLVQTHARGFPGERWLQQRQKLCGVPVTEVKYNWKEVPRTYWVYGDQRKCHAPDYPQDCCWGCNIL